MNKILWLHEKNFSAKAMGLLHQYMRAADVNPAYAFFVTMHYRVPDMWIKKPKTKDTWMMNRKVEADFFRELDDYIATTKADMIVVSDVGTLAFITGQYSLDRARGGVYRYKDIPVMVIDFNTARIHAQKYFPWLILQDLKKLRRWWKGEKRVEPKFDYMVCQSEVEVLEMAEFLHNSLFISTDIETLGDFITCIGFTGLKSNGKIRSFVVPFFDPTKEGQSFWQSAADECVAWQTVKEILENEAIKAMQNGTYDCAYFVKYNLGVRNYLLDSSHLFHCIWCESPKRLDFISSLLLDHYRYWKADIKGEKNEKIPTTPEGMQRYWRYNALDCHNTLFDCLRLLSLITRPGLEWALSNYKTQFANQVGPAFSMSMTGAKADKQRQKIKNVQWLEEHKKALAELRIMCDKEDFNPNSPAEVASLIYDVLGAQPIKMKGKKKLSERSVDEKVLRLIKVQHPIFDIYIQKIWDCKKPLNNSSKYGPIRQNSKGKFVGMQLLNERFMYQYGAAGTESGRYNGKEHQFWIGTNPQNVPDKLVRDMIIADDGYFLAEFDYAQSDNWFIAFECEDQEMMKNVSDVRDTHSVHAEFFFNVDYNKLVDEHARGTDYADHPVNGIRQNAKRIVHGSNFQMAGFTLYVTMGHEAVIATAKALGHTDADSWPRSRLVKLCDSLVVKYTTQLYPRLNTWFDESARECATNGNLATCAFGRTRLFFGDVLEDAAVQRELSSYYGQGGTAGNINRSLLRIYYESSLLERGMILLMQTHDSILVQIPLDKFEMTKEMLTIMEQPCTIKGRTFTVPVDFKLGFSWGKKGMVNYHDDVTVDYLRKHEDELRTEYQAYV